MKRFLLYCVVISAFFSLNAGAQEYPNKPVRLIVSVPAGGLQDALARGLANYMSETLGQQFIVDNRPGANTIIAAQLASKSPADGYTLLIATDSTMSINPHLYASLAYDPQRDFVPISQLVRLTEVLFVNAELPVKTLKEYVDYGLARPGTINYASFGIGSTAHLAGEEFRRVTGVQQTHVPFKGGADAMLALATNQVQSLITATAVAMPMVKAGKVKILAVAGPRRLPAIPDVSTFAESGYPGYESSAWFGLVAPAGTPPAIVQKLAAAAGAYVKTKDFQDKFVVPFSIEAVGSTPDAFATFMRDDRVRYAKIVRDANAKLD